ncbi:MAG: tagaturonate epimerase family protein, partial [Candidatus Heimdallarchaeaceae archaeon]
TSGVVKFNIDQADSIESEGYNRNEINYIYDYHLKSVSHTKLNIEININIIERMLFKYEDSLTAMKQLDDYLASIKGSGSYDLEWSLDEIPSGISVEDNITTDNELFFLLNEIKRREINLTHIAPNFGVEKGVDYRMKSGRDYLYELIKSLHRISSEFGIMLDVHSGDNLSSETRQTINKASGGKIHYKISPITQEIFAQTLFETDHEKFLFWWEEALRYAEIQAEKGSDFAVKCLKEINTSKKKPTPEDAVFHYYHYPPVGENVKDGNPYLREYLYSLDAEFSDAYSRKLTVYLDSISNDLFTTKKRFV